MIPVSNGGVDASLEFEAAQDNETYKKNVEIGRQVSVLLDRGKVLEKSLSKQNKFLLGTLSSAAANNGRGEWRFQSMATATLRYHKYRSDG